MNSLLRQAFSGEICLAKRLIRARRLDDASVHLERAHVLGQAYVRPHVLTHWLMLTVAAQHRDHAAVWGQIVRIILGAVGSAIGSVPSGNTGGSNVSMFKHMPIDPELANIMQGRVVDSSVGSTDKIL